VEHFRWLQYLLVLTNTMIGMGLLPTVKTPLTDKLFPLVMKTADRYGLLHTNNPRSITRGRAAVRVLVLVRAILLVFGTPLGRLVQDSGKLPFHLHHMWRLAPFLVDNDPGIFTAAIGLLCQEFEDPFRFKVINALCFHMFLKVAQQSRLSAFIQTDLLTSTYEARERRFHQLIADQLPASSSSSGKSTPRPRAEPVASTGTGNVMAEHWEKIEHMLKEFLDPETRTAYVIKGAFAPPRHIDRRQTPEMYYQQKLATAVHHYMEKSIRFRDISRTLGKLATTFAPPAHPSDEQKCPLISFDNGELRVAACLFKSNVENALFKAVKSVMEHKQAVKATYTFGMHPTSRHCMRPMVVNPSSRVMQLRNPHSYAKEHVRQMVQVHSDPSIREQIVRTLTRPPVMLVRHINLEDHFFNVHLETEVGVSRHTQEKYNLYPESTLRTLLQQMAPGKPEYPGTLFSGMEMRSPPTTLREGYRDQICSTSHLKHAPDSMQSPQTTSSKRSRDVGSEDPAPASKRVRQEDQVARQLDFEDNSDDDVE
jgi:hypothetical protein